MFSPQWQEEMDYQMGVGTELQNAYHLSQMERKPGDMPRINELVRQGRFCVVVEGTDYCPRTDAVLGSRTLLVADYGTQQEAEACLEKEQCDDPDPECYYHILPREVPSAQPQSEPSQSGFKDGEIPF